MGEWRRVRLGEVATEVTVGHVGSMANEYRDTGVPFLRSQNVLPHRIDLSDVKFIDDEFHARLKKSALRPGDVVTVRTGKPGTSAVVPDWMEAGNCADLVITRPGPELDSKWLSYYLNFVTDVDIAQHLVGAVQQHFNVGSAKALVLHMPERVEQEAIAGVLGALDDKIEANDRIASLSLKLANRLFLQTLSTTDCTARKNLGEIADRGAIEFSDGYRTKKVEHGRPGLRILRAGDVRDSYIYPNGDDYVSQDYSRKIGLKASRPGDVVLTTKGTVGRVAIVGDEVEQVVYSPQVCFFRVKDVGRVDPGYLGGWFRSDDLQRQAATLMHKSDMAPYISLRDIRSLALPLPPIEDQRRCGEAQNGLMAISEASRVENNRLARTRDQLLPLLMSGKLTVKAAESVVEEAV